jgi:hypothetical protein
VKDSHCGETQRSDHLSLPLNCTDTVSSSRRPPAHQSPAENPAACFEKASPPRTSLPDCPFGEGPPSMHDGCDCHASTSGHVLSESTYVSSSAITINTRHLELKRCWLLTRQKRLLRHFQPFSCHATNNSEREPCASWTPGYTHFVPRTKPGEPPIVQRILRPLCISFAVRMRGAFHSIDGVSRRRWAF